MVFKIRDEIRSACDLLCDSDGIDTVLTLFSDHTPNLMSLVNL